MTRDRLEFRTPEGVRFSVPLAGPAARMLALLLDIAVIGAAGSLVAQALAPLKVISADAAQAVAAVAYFVVSVGYGMALEWWWRGQTVGKRVLRLRVVDAQGLRLTPSQVVVRNLMRLLDSLPVLYLVGGIACFVSARRQRLGDLAANTLVVRTEETTLPDVDAMTGGKYNSLREHRHLVARLRQRVPPELGAVAVQALLRREQFEPPARVALFRELANEFRELVRFPEEATETVADEQYVRNVVELLYRA